MVDVRYDTLAQGLVALATGLVYGYVARLVLQRRTSPEARRANDAFATWWACFGLLEGVAGAYQVANAFGYQDLTLIVTVLDLVFLLLVAAIWGLVYYLVYLYTGSSRPFWPLAFAYGSLAAGLLYLLAWLDPSGFNANGTLATARVLPPAVGVALGLVLALPIVVAAVAYGSLYFRVDGRAQRFRIAIVAGSFLAWFLWSTVSSLLQLSTRSASDATLRSTLAVVNAAIALAVPVLVVLAYKLPARHPERFGVDPTALG
jgi:hypothetical protein